MQELADECNVSRRPIRYWLRKHGIAIRDRDPPVNTHLVGESHPMWAGGKQESECEQCGVEFTHRKDQRKYCSPECTYQSRRCESPKYGVGWTKQKRESVRERDNYTCQGCGMDGEQHRREFGHRLHVHHIVPARQFSNPQTRNAEDNLITLCVSCHPRWEAVPGLRPKLAD